MAAFKRPLTLRDVQVEHCEIAVGNAPPRLVDRSL